MGENPRQVSELAAASFASDTDSTRSSLLQHRHRSAVQPRLS